MPFAGPEARRVTLSLGTVAGEDVAADQGRVVGEGGPKRSRGRLGRRGQRGRPPLRGRSRRHVGKLRLNYKRVAYLWYISVLLCIHVCPQ